MSIIGYDTFSEARERFKWDQRWSLFEGDREYFNLSHECLDRHVAAGRGGEVGLRIVRPDGSCDVCTFSALDNLAQRLGNVLLERGVERGDRVAVRLEPTREFVAAMFGALKIGAIFVPCTPLLGAEAAAARIADAAPKVTLLETAHDLGDYQPPGTVLDRPALAAALAGAQAGLETVRTRAEEPAIYIYSSGTTGRPKRTALQHQGFTYLTVIVGEFVLGLTAADRYVACYTPGYLGGFGWGILVPMALGTAGGIYAGKFDAQALLTALSAQKCTALQCPPTAYRQLVRARPGHALSLTKLAYTAEAMDATLAGLIHDAFGTYACGHYGATEVGMIAVDYAYPDYAVRPGAIGKPLLDTDIAIVDENLQRLPAGEIGQVALVRHGKVLLAGDFGTFDPDGYLWYRGRANDVIISGGHTISAVEIEDALIRHPAVDQVAVVAAPDSERGTVPKAFVRLVAGAAAAASPAALTVELQDVVRKTLGRYAYPREVVFVDEFQRNEAGKIVKSVLK